jgi:hypothetical protein
VYADRRGRDRLFQEDVLAGREGRFGRLDVEVVREHDENGLDVRIVEWLLPSGRDFGPRSDPMCARLHPIQYGIHKPQYLDVWPAGEELGNVCSTLSCSQDGAAEALPVQTRSAPVGAHPPLRPNVTPGSSLSVNSTSAASSCAL